MPSTDIKPNYAVTFTSAEYRLVTMALAGLLKDPQDTKAALELNVHLCHQRSHNLNLCSEVAEKSLEMAKKLVKDYESINPNNES